jgi:hypothetical protein
MDMLPQQFRVLFAQNKSEEGTKIRQKKQKKKKRSREIESVSELQKKRNKYNRE